MKRPGKLNPGNVEIEAARMGWAGTQI